MVGAFLNNLGCLSLLEGDHERATALCEEAAALHRRQRHKGGLEIVLDSLGWAALVRGDLDQATASHEESLALCKELGSKLAAAESLDGLACGAAARGEAERSARLFGAAEALRETVGYHHLPEERALREPYLTSARAGMDQVAWERAFAQGTAMTLDEAVGYALSPEKPPPISASGQPVAGTKPVTLTPREEEVAALVARGFTNRQIASELVLSEHTVHRHVTNILKKLNLRSRGQVAHRLRAS